MVDATHISFAASDRSYFSLLKKEIHRRSVEAGIEISKIHQIDLIVAEMTSNLFKYANDGEILFGLFHNAGNPYVELISIDNGPGITNPSKMMLDGMSSSNTMGHGLGSIKRLSDVFDLYTQVGWGTVVLSRIYNNANDVKKKVKYVIRPIIVAKPGEETSGDGMAVKATETYLKVMLADGLGHGPEANKAVSEAENSFRVFPDYSPTETLRFLHQNIKRTRGAVVNITGFDFANKKWSSTGVGNISARLIGPNSVRNHMSYNGIIGHNIPNTMNDQHYPAEQYNCIVLCSDGIKTRWDMAKYPMIYKNDPAVWSAVIYKDHARKTDDMSVVTIKIM